MSGITKLWFVKARRAQNQDDDETWKQGGVCTTLNAFDNGGESRATVLVLQSTQPNAAIDDDLSPTLVQAMGKGGGHVPILIIDGTRVDDVRVTDDEIMQTVIQRWGTGGGNVPAIAYSIREDATANNFSATEIEQARALQALQPSVQSHHAQTFIAQNVAPTLTAYNMDSRSPQSEEQQRIINSVYSNTLQVRRLTPMECERLQGFPDGWTDTQSDSQRYRQMGNAVTVNVIESIGQQLGRVSNG